MGDEPSDGAVRAAERIIAWQWRNDARDSITADPGVIWQLAAIIDRQTGLPELLATLTVVVDRIGLANIDNEPVLSAWLPTARAAIAKAKGDAT